MQPGPSPLAAILCFSARDCQPYVVCKACQKMPYCSYSERPAWCASIFLREPAECVTVD